MNKKSTLKEMVESMHPQTHVDCAYEYQQPIVLLPKDVGKLRELFEEALNELHTLIEKEYLEKGYEYKDRTDHYMKRLEKIIMEGGVDHNQRPRDSDSPKKEGN